MENYEKLLDEAYVKIKPIQANAKFDRFEVPKANVQVFGNKTYIDNFLQICSYIRREGDHLMKFLSKELASYCKIENERLMLNRKISIGQINEKLNLYINTYVICKECNKPDTELVKQEGLLFMHCLACGAKHSLGRA